MVVITLGFRMRSSRTRANRNSCINHSVTARLCRGKHQVWRITAAGFRIAHPSVCSECFWARNISPNMLVDGFLGNLRYGYRGAWFQESNELILCYLLRIQNNRWDCSRCAKFYFSWLWWTSGAMQGFFWKKTCLMRTSAKACTPCSFRGESPSLAGRISRWGGQEFT